jgi:hypothetical protein
MKDTSEILHDRRGDCHAGPCCGGTNRNKASKWLLSLTGIASLVWFLIRVLPKPSRAAYPCQRVAAPIAASFVMWLTGILGSAFAYRRWRINILHGRRLATVLCVVAGLGAAVLTVSNMPRNARASGYPAFHDPIGVAKGVKPGRVAWAWNPGATNWAGYDSSAHWYDDAQTDPIVCERMISQSIRAITGKTTDAAAWDAIFRYFNLNRYGVDRGYQAGEKICIKINNVTCNIAMNSVNTSTWNKTSYINNVDVSPQAIRGLLRQLVYVVGVNQSDITLSDSTAYWPNQYLNLIKAEYPNVKMEQYSSGTNRQAAAFSSSPMNWSTADANGKDQDYFLTSYDQATYLIDFAVLKGHSAGVSLCGKNNYGSLKRLPNGKLGTVQMNYYSLHNSLPNPAGTWGVPGVGHYRAIVDLMGHRDMGGKTLLYLLDGLYSGYWAECKPYLWQSAPFNNDWPSSIFVSQDPVAIDSVGYDFLKAEWPSVVSDGVPAYGPDGLQGGAEDYIHEAALANNPPSGTFYDPEHDGFAMQSLGVHEHWNNSTLKQYSRNRGLHQGIELLSLRYDDGAIQRAKCTGNTSTVVVAGGIITAATTNDFYIQSDDRQFGIRVYKASHGFARGARVNVFGSMAGTDERYIAATKVVADGTATPRPIYLSCRDVGGGTMYSSPGVVAQKGVVDGRGANNIGALIKVCGKVTSVDGSSTPTYFYVSDGSGVSVKVMLQGLTLPGGIGTRVTVTGISSCEGTGTLYPLILATAIS